jgi:hypothetical protein
MATPSLIHSHQVKPSDGRVNMAHHSELLQKYMTCNRVMRFCLTTLSLIKPLSQVLFISRDSESNLRIYVTMMG